GQFICWRIAATRSPTSPNPIMMASDLRPISALAEGDSDLSMSESTRTVLMPYHIREDTVCLVFVLCFGLGRRLFYLKLYIYYLPLFALPAYWITQLSSAYRSRRGTPVPQLTNLRPALPLFTVRCWLGPTNGF